MSCGSSRSRYALRKAAPARAASRGTSSRVALRMTRSPGAASSCMSARDPAAGHRKHLPDETVGGVTAEVGGELRILLRGHQAAQRHLALKALLEFRIRLHLG